MRLHSRVREEAENVLTPFLEELTNSLKTFIIIILFNLTLDNNTACSAILLEVANCRGESWIFLGEDCPFLPANAILNDHLYAQSFTWCIILNSKIITKRYRQHPTPSTGFGADAKVFLQIMKHSTKCPLLDNKNKWFQKPSTGDEQIHFIAKLL